MNALNAFKDVVGSLTGIIVSLVGLGVSAGVVFVTDVAFVPNVLDNLMALVAQLGDAGLVGIIVLAVLLDIYR